MRYFLVAATVVAAIASAAVYAVEIKLDDKEQAQCQAEGGCFVMTRGLLNELLKRARAEGCKGSV